MHPQTIGRGHRLLMLERLLDYIQGHAGVVFRTMEEHATVWSDEHPFRTTAATRE